MSPTPVSSGSPTPVNPNDFVGKRATIPPHLPAGTYAALVVDGTVYAGRMHNVAWQLAGMTGNVDFYGFATIDASGTVTRLLQ